jgi:hypothetical protein
MVRLVLVTAFLAMTACGDGAVPPTPLDMMLFSGPLPDLQQKVCPPSCMSHAQCQTACAPAPAGANCCDLPTRTCYVVATGTCPMPAPPDMATVMTGPY